MLALAMPACSKKKDDEAKPAEPPAATQAAPPSTGKSMMPAPGAPAPTGTFDASAFCKQVFPSADVARIVGTGGLEAAEKRPPAPAGMARCKVEKDDPTSHMPVAMALLMVDCGPAHLDVAKHRAVAKAMGGSKGGAYRELEMGKGGAYTKTMVLKKPSYTVTFVDDKVPCAVTVSTSFIDADHAEELAHAVYDRLTEQNYPRP